MADDDLTPWLRNRMTLEEVEAKYPILTVERRLPRTALWTYTGRWKEIKSKMQEGDELWWYFVKEPVQHGGIALVRGGKVEDHVTLLMV
jgi:hypothetical protein